MTQDQAIEEMILRKVRKAIKEYGCEPHQTTWNVKAHRYAKIAQKMLEKFSKNEHEIRKETFRSKEKERRDKGNGGKNISVDPACAQECAHEALTQILEGKEKKGEEEQGATEERDLRIFEMVPEKLLEDYGKANGLIFDKETHKEKKAKSVEQRIKLWEEKHPGIAASIVKSALFFEKIEKEGEKETKKGSKKM